MNQEINITPPDIEEFALNVAEPSSDTPLVPGNNLARGGLLDMYLSLALPYREWQILRTACREETAFRTEEDELIYVDAGLASELPEAVSAELVVFNNLMTVAFALQRVQVGGGVKHEYFVIIPTEFDPTEFTHVVCAIEAKFFPEGREDDDAE